MTVLIILLAISAAGLITELVARHEPFGYQDEHGFHFGTEIQETPKAFELENPS